MANDIIMEEEAPEINLENSTTKSEDVRGMPKSGRWWKSQQKQRHTAIIRVKSLKVSAAQNKKERLRKQVIKAKEAEIRDAIAAEKAQRIQQQKDREERRKANERRGEVVQVIRNTAKLSHTKKKKLRNIQTRDTN